MSDINYSLEYWEINLKNTVTNQKLSTLYKYHHGFEIEKMKIEADYPASKSPKYGTYMFTYEEGKIWISEHNTGREIEMTVQMT